MFFQGRGNVYLSVLDGSLNIGPVRYKLCTDSILIKPKSETFSHINKCGAVDVEDARGTKSNAVDVTISLADLQDKLFALGIFGTVGTGGSGTVSDEALPAGVAVDDYYFLGGKTRHRGVSALVITDSASPANTLIADTDYVLEDAATGRVKFLAVVGKTQPFLASYSYVDPADVTMFTAGQREYFLSYEFINKQNANDAGSLELYRVRFDPADNLDFQSDELQIMTLNGSALADTSRDSDDALGQFGRRVL